MDGRTLVIAGASGLVGGGALPLLLASGEVDRVVALGRRILPIDHPRLCSSVADFQSVPAILREIPEGVAVAVCCLGTTRKQAGSRAAFRAVDHDAVVAFARAARERGAGRFVVVSSLGADAGSRSFYLRTKGEAEASLRALGYRQLTILRPSMIDDRGARAERRLGERLALPLGRALFSVVGKTRRQAPIEAETIARALVRVSFDATLERVRIVESDELHALGR